MTSSIHFVKVAEHNLKDYESLSFSAVSSKTRCRFKGQIWHR